VYFLYIVVNLVLSASATDCLTAGLVSEVTCDMSSGTLNLTDQLTNCERAMMAGFNFFYCNKIRHPFSIEMDFFMQFFIATVFVCETLERCAK